ncbi:unnamed protein product [Rhodiola kirilowii]
MMEKKMDFLENFVRNQQDSLRSLFLGSGSRKSSLNNSPVSNSPKPIPFLSPMANSVVARCSQILQISTEQLQHRFDIEFPDTVKESSSHARSILEFCSYLTLHKLTEARNYLSDKDFRRLTFDMMIAWEDPVAESELSKETTFCTNQEVEDEDGRSLFYSDSTNMAIQVDSEKTVGQGAFTRIASACPVIADVITVHNLFDALTISSNQRLHFLIYDKYLNSIDRVIKAVKSCNGPSSTSNLQLAEGETILEIDGTIPTQPVLQHIGMAAWPGRLTLTNVAIYFESGVGLYDKAVRYDLATDLKQVLKADLTGPLGARIFDKAVMYKAMTVTEPIYLEFPEFNGHQRRDYWLDLCLEILRAHIFIRKYNLKETQQSEAMARATLGILRCRAVREAFRVFSSDYKTLLAFNLAECLPGGDLILETIASRLALVNCVSPKLENSGTLTANQRLIARPDSLLALIRLGLAFNSEANLGFEGIGSFKQYFIGEANPLEVAVKQSLSHTGKVEAAKATVDKVRVEGIDTNIAVMKALLFPVIGLGNWLQYLASWKEPVKSSIFLVLNSYIFFKGWINYLLAMFFVFLSLFTLWQRISSKGKSLEPFRIKSPPNRNAVEQLITLQDAIAQGEELIQAGNIVLLKIRALVFAVVPQATDTIAAMLILTALVVAFVPLKYIIMFAVLEAYTREMPLRKDSSDRWLRRVREWWVRIPAAPVTLVKHDENKKKN